MPLLTSLASHALAHPDRVAHRVGGEELSWGELWRRSGALAAAFVERLPGRAGVVVHAHKQSLALVCFLACLRAGRPYVPVDDSITPARLRAVLAVSGADLVLAPSPLPADLDAGVPVWSADELHVLTRGEASPDPALAAGPGDAWYVIFTSGSTGEPKGVVITGANLASFVGWASGLLPPGPHVVLNQAPWSFDLSVMDTWVSLATGSTLVSLHRDHLADPAALAHALAASEADAWVSTPSFAALCLALPTFDAGLVDVRTFLFCGETLPAATVRALRSRFPAARLWNTYGPTEATVAVTGVEIDDAVLATHGVLPVGWPKPGCTITVRDDDGAEVPAGHPGEIWLHGDTVSPGYLNRPDLTAISFAPAVVGGREEPTYRTGDTGALHGGLLFFHGRRDHQVKLHGYRIELGDIETHLADLAEVAEAVVLAPRDETGTVTHLTAVVRLADPELPRGLTTTLRLRRRLGEVLPAYMVPKAFAYTDELPLTTNGKVDRTRLAAAVT